MLEVLVHLDREDLPNNYVVLTIEVPDRVPVERGTYSDALASNGSNPVWIVPSIIVPREHNIVLYPDAAGYDSRILNVEPFAFDERLVAGSLK